MNKSICNLRDNFPNEQSHAGKEDEQERLNRYLQKIARGTSHDINNVFTYILGMAELAQLQPDIPESMQNVLQKIVTYVERGRGITQHLIDYGNSFQCRCEIFNLSVFLNRWISELNLTLPEKQKIKLQLDNKQLNINADESILKRALTALVLNASESLLEAESSVQEINIQVQTIDDLILEITISDKGIGIEPDDMSNLFTPFSTSKRAAKHVGMGLTVAEQAVLIHGGKIEISSTPYQGCEVKLLLPVLVK
ncbi:HAMP domain-containing histidine kinase [Paraneptunicella aestuarii]|uniref:sensor histidine kinase n=1 Tax=Paraneptunicella aestuarii TaxID=2831148 RepID=UPI001E4CF660|nr:HAMP domain-containing sensor histidine kinase [Paraneptunicella aestuarii]UAA38932.1 HAMP domain-containing histidine kinase [Paraneptunicella aestuarii]